MDILIRLYRMHDMDLINLNHTPNFSLPNAMREVLRAYVRGNMTRIRLPTAHHEFITKYSEQIHLYLNLEEDADVIQYVHRLQHGMRCSAIKNLFRSFLEIPNTFIYTDTNYVEQDLQRMQVLRTSEESSVLDLTSPVAKSKKRKPKVVEIKPDIETDVSTEVIPKTLIPPVTTPVKKPKVVKQDTQQTNTSSSNDLLDLFSGMNF